MSIKLYEYLTGGRQKIADLLAMPGTEDIEFETPRSPELAHPAELS
ncbi:hypothetical protein PT7_0312 [Pusillimonas sp. T7-7]|nr:hypothetical protein PT7_0312 [Pusillimonas sp. T7-7]